ncbi:hypothetical protein GCM10029964_060220 [Kibdelosporangium lantanae]
MRGRHGERVPAAQLAAGQRHLPGCAAAGETQVFPVAGPVKQHFAGRSDAAAPHQSELAKAVQNEIGRINSVR